MNQMRYSFRIRLTAVVLLCSLRIHAVTGERLLRADEHSTAIGEATTTAVDYDMQRDSASLGQDANQTSEAEEKHKDTIAHVSEQRRLCFD